MPPFNNFKFSNQLLILKNRKIIKFATEQNKTLDE